MQKRFLSFILICIYILMISMIAPGCMPNKTSLSPTDALVIYLPPQGAGFEWISTNLRNALGTFRHQYPDVKVTARDFNDPQNPQEAYKMYLETLKTELTAGKGPDLVYIETGDLGDIEKTIDSGIFFDLNRAIAQDDTFSKEDYIPSLIEVCCRGDVLPLLPVDYLAPVLITSQQAMDEASLIMSTDQSLETFLALLEQYYTQTNTRQPLDFYTPKSFFTMLLNDSGISILDYKNKSVTLDSAPFRQLAQTYKVLYTREQDVPEADQAADLNSSEFFVNGGSLFTSAVGGSGILSSCLEIAMAGQTPIIFPIPSSEGTSAKGMLTPMLLAGIPQSSPNKLNAYNLLKILLEETQNPQTNTSIQHTMRLDILPDVLNILSSKAINKLHDRGKGVTADPEQIEAVRSDIVEQVQTLLTNAPATLGLPAAVRGILWEEMEPYFKGSRSLDDAIASAQGKLQLYIAE